MTIRQGVMITMLTYLTFCSIFFGWVFANPLKGVSAWIALICLFAAQITAVRLLMLVTRTENK